MKIKNPKPSVNRGVKEFKIPLMDIDAELLEIPEAEFSADIEMISSQFGELVNQLSIFGSEFEIKCSDNIIITGNGENGSMNAVIKNDDILDYGDIKIIQSSYEVYNGSEKLDLTLKEFELLVYFVINKGKALSRDQLLTNLWGFSYDGDSRVVDVHVFKLREKIDPKAEKIKTVRGIGYKLV